MKKLSTLFITLLAVVSLFAQERILQIGDVEIPIESNIEYQFVPENNSVKLMIDKVEEHSFPMPVNIEFVTNYTISVTGVSLSSSTLTLIQGSDASLIATITPPDATNKNLVWTSSKESVATVTNNGKIITLGVGETIITVTTVDGEFKASCVITVNPPKVPVSGIALSHTTLNLNRGDVETIEATITPPDASNQVVQWKTADESVATVSNTGKVTAVGAGATTIIATTDDGGKTAQCNVTVKIPVTSISIVQTDAEIAVGKSYQLDVDISPENATNQTIIWESSDESVATVNHNGKVTALKVGTTTITATVEGEDKSSTSTITVYQPDVLVTTVSLNVHEVHVSVGDESKLIATILPPNATNKTLAWSSSDETIVIVDVDGNVEAIASGEAYIKVSAANGTFSDSCKFVVSTIAVAVEGVSLSSKTLALSVGKSISIEATVTPSNATNKDVIWSSTDNSVATVDATGKITAVGAGQAIITATTVNNAKTASCTVTVRVPVTGIAITNVTDSIEKGKTHQFEVEFSPENATNKTITWKSLDESVATITQYGKVTAVATGTVTITVTTEDGNHIATHEVTVFEPDVEVLGVVLNTHSVELSEGSNTSLIAMVSPPNASNTAVVWTSADKSIAVVDSQGKISALKEGETYIKVTTEDGNYSDSCLLVVNSIAVPVEEVQISTKIMYVRVNEDAIITATVLPEFASNKSVVWSSSDETIVSITDEGKITAHKEGKVLLIVIAQDGGHADSCTLIVNNEFIMHNAFVYIPVVNPATGKTWLDRNLGASQVATSSTDERAYGDLYQWGRQADGHEKRNSNIAAVLSDSDTPDHDKFIIVNATPNDWRKTQNNALWQGPEHKNNPCPAGYKVPTQVEWQEELDSWDSENDMGAFASILKLPMAGYRSNTSGEVSGIETAGRYWASTIDGTSAYRLYVIDDKAVVDAYSRGIGYSVRCIKDESIYVGSITLDKTTANIEKTDNLQLTATVLPADATNKNLSWASSDKSVATVDNNGKVAALKVGTATITATTEDGGYTAACELTVFVVGVESIEISDATLELEKGATKQLTATVLPENAYNKTVLWTSANESVATVDNEGNITTLQVGTTTITATTEDGGYTAACELTVFVVGVESIEISDATLELEKGTTKQLTATVLPANATNKTITWESLDESVATVDADGIITALQVGTTTITATTEDGGYTAECEVTVFIISVESIEISDATLELEKGATKQLTVTVLPADATNKTIIWESSDESIATVDENGNVTAISAGNVTITATIEDGGYTAECAITVFISVESIEISDATLEIGKGTTLQLIATVLPANATNKNLSWSSSDESIVTVDADGLITAIEVGSATIIVQSDNGIIDSCEFTVLTELIIHDGFNYGVVTNPATGQTWLDRNLGASRVATSIDDELSFGDLYQWGRGTDGHEKRNSATTSTLSDNDTPGHGDFITTNSASNDWRSSQNDNLWQGVDSINNPCPDGYRIPTKAEFDNELKSRSINNFEDAFNSPLKMSKAGFRFFNGNFNSSSSCFWSSDVGGTSVYSVYISDSDFAISTSPRATGNSVRCIRHEEPATSVSLDKATVEVEVTKTVQLIANVLPTDAFNKNVMWSSADETVATVDNEGIITALKIGSITITATTVDGGFEDSCVVTVIPHTGTFIDERDSTEYKWVQIGEQVWMAENMRYLPQVNNISESSETEARYYVYDYDGNNLDDATATDEYITYGTLYNWEAALQACPEGWHLPNNAEWEELLNFAGGGSEAATRLKSATAWSVNNINGTDEYGFSILPAGEKYQSSFTYLHSYASFWLAEENSNLDALYSYVQNTIKVEDYEKYQAVSVRCLKD